MAQLTANFELGTNGNDVLTTDPGSATAWDTRQAAGGTIKYSTQKAHGSLSGQFDHSSSGAAKNMQWDTALGTVTDHYGRFYMYLTANPGSDTSVCMVLSSGTILCSLRVMTDGKIRVLVSTGAIATTSTNSVSLNQWVRIEYHVLHSLTVGQTEVKLFNTAESSTPTETNTSTADKNTGASGNQIRFGAAEATTAPWVEYLDDIVANATSYPGPVVSPGGVVLVDQTAEILLLTRPH